jgi:tRNA modification GTPase
VPLDSVTICAVATAAGPAGVAVVRVSGPQAFAAATRLAGVLPDARRVALRMLRRPSDNDPLDSALVLTFAAPASFTGEDVVEFHLHGGAAVVGAVLEALAVEPGLRPAEAGEFTRRAFENGKLDLTAVEGLADLVGAETEGQRRQALRQMDGALSRLYEGWRADLISLMASLEAEIDFPDEGDVTPEAVELFQSKVLSLRAALSQHLNESKRGERLRDGVRCAIVGAPNAGKSSLLNRLARREAAIVSDIPGTTRDVVEVRLVLASAPVWIADTAGLRDAADVIEAEGVRRALARAEESDLRIGVVDGAGAVEDWAPLPLQPGDVLVVAKSDLAPGAAADAALAWALEHRIEAVRASPKSGAGLEVLEAWLTRRVEAITGLTETPSLSRIRHRRHVADAVAALDRAHESIHGGPELAGEDLRTAAHALGRITGRVDVEDLLDKIFSDFCIGK